MEQHQPSWLRLSPQKSVDSALAKLEGIAQFNNLISGTRAARAGDAFQVMPWAEVRSS